MAKKVKQYIENEWLSSKETKAKLKISDCKLMHLRTEGKLEFKKDKNAFFYKQIKKS